MAAPKVRSDYDQLARIARAFAENSRATQATLHRLKGNVEALRAGDWVGTGASAFYREFDQSINPTLTRLVNALASAQAITLQISQVMKAAEDEAAACFRLPGSGQTATGLGAAAGGVDNAAAGGAASGGAATRGSGAAGASGSASAFAGAQTAATGGQPLAVRDPKTVFTEAYFDEMVRTQVQGSDSRELNTTMERLMNNPPPAERDSLLARVAALRGRPVTEIRAEYEKFLQIQRSQRQKPDELDIDSQWYDASDYPDFLGSTVSLRYGKVVGDVFGIDPVFGALLNPTGGIMGPGSSSLPQPGANRPLAFHSVFHDAAGYLMNAHGIGPGYDYLGQESAYDPAHPLTGQLSGIRYWHGRMDSPGPDWIVETAIERGLENTIGRVRKPRGGWWELVKQVGP
jgi:WXG100 family type VII secretion target